MNMVLAPLPAGNGLLLGWMQILPEESEQPDGGDDERELQPKAKPERKRIFGAKNRTSAPERDAPLLQGIIRKPTEEQCGHHTHSHTRMRVACDRQKYRHDYEP